MISTASYPALRASATDFAKSVAVRSTAFVDSARGRNGVIGDFAVRRRDAERVVAVPAGVQHLQGDRAALVVDRAR